MGGVCGLKICSLGGSPTEGGNFVRKVSAGTGRTHWSAHRVQWTMKYDD